MDYEKNRKFIDKSHFILASLLIISILFTVHLEWQLKLDDYEQDALLKTITKEKAIIHEEEELIEKYQLTTNEMAREINKDEAYMAKLNTQNQMLIKEFKFFEFIMTSVDLMKVHNYIETEYPDIQEMASSMTEEELFNFVKEEISYIFEEGSSNVRASDVLKDREGNCVAQSALMTSFLRAKGYSQYEVFVVLGTIDFNGLPGETPKIHSWVEFEHDGTWMVLDTTPYLGDYSFDSWTREDFYRENNAMDYIIYNDKMSPHLFPEFDSA